MVDIIDAYNIAHPRASEVSKEEGQASVWPFAVLGFVLDFKKTHGQPQLLSFFY
jgi:hypothetical protein